MARVRRGQRTAKYDLLDHNFLEQSQKCQGLSQLVGEQFFSRRQEGSRTMISMIPVPPLACLKLSLQSLPLFPHLLEGQELLLALLSRSSQTERGVGNLGEKGPAVPSTCLCRR